MNSGRGLCISLRDVKVREREGGACQVYGIFGCFKKLYVPCTCHWQYEFVNSYSPAIFASQKS